MANEPSRQMRGAGNPGLQPVQFTLTDAQRIATVVGQVESERRTPQASSLPRATTGLSHYLSKTYRKWLKETGETLYIYAGQPLSEQPLVATNETVVAWNHFGDVEADEWVILGRANGTFYLLGSTGGGGGVFRGTYSGAWPNGGAIQVVTEDVTGNRYQVKNWLTPISGSGGKCVFGAATGEYVLISFDLTDLDGYGGTCILGSEGGSLKWFETIICT
jgi:hypothetical protein